MAAEVGSGGHATVTAPDPLRPDPLPPGLLARAAKALGVLLLLGAAAYIAALAYLFLFQRSYVFNPSGTLKSPAEAGLPLATQVIKLTARDGVQLTGWYSPPAAGLPTILYFHGNAGNLSDRASRFQQIIGSGFGLFAVSYRGFPGSGGAPSEAALFADAIETFDWLAARASLIVLHGESLGTGVAAHVAAERPAEALILEAPYTSALDLAAAAYPWVPVSLLMRDPFMTREAIKGVDEPVLIVHGDQDALIPVRYGRELFALANDPKQLVVISGGAHGDLWKRGLWPLVTDFLGRYGIRTQPVAAVRRIPSLAG